MNDPHKVSRWILHLSDLIYRALTSRSPTTIHHHQPTHINGSNPLKIHVTINAPSCPARALPQSTKPPTYPVFIIRNRLTSTPPRDHHKPKTSSVNNKTKPPTPKPERSRARPPPFLFVVDGGAGDGPRLRLRVGPNGDDIRPPFTGDSCAAGIQPSVDRDGGRRRCGPSHRHLRPFTLPPPPPSPPPVASPSPPPPHRHLLPATPGLVLRRLLPSSFPIRPRRRRHQIPPFVRLLQIEI